jgi:NAD(P)-dependent dehydrogenase (short-subunit alcohol dehydrogenase family)
MKRLEGKIALVTGAAAGNIGHASASALAQDGAVLVVADLNVKGGQAVVDEINKSGGRASFYRADVTSEAEVAALVKNIVAEFGGLHCAFNNVGLGKTGVTITDESLEDWDWCMNICLKSTFLCMKYEIPAMLAAGGGTIVNTASMAGVIYSDAASPSYSAAKAGVIHLTKYAANAYASHNIRVNSISPGLVATPLVTGMFSAERLETIAGQVQLIARPVRLSEIGDAVVYLCSDRSSMITGINLEVCGGAR